MWTSTSRSSQQNRAYFKLVVEFLASQCNTTKEAMHKALAVEFLGYDIVHLPSGSIIRTPKSTSSLTTTQFKQYVEKIQRYAAENGLDIPNPNEEAK